MPAWISRCCHARRTSRAAGSKPRTATGGEAVAAGRVVHARLDSRRVRRCEPARRGRPGRVNGWPSACESSRAMPRAQKQYPRSGVIASSMTMSSSPTTGRASSPGAAVGRRWQHDDPGVVIAKPSSRAEQIMPAEVRPYVCRAGDGEPARQHAAGQRRPPPGRRRRSWSRRRRSTAVRRSRSRRRRRPGNAGSAS